MLCSDGAKPNYVTLLFLKYFLLLYLGTPPQNLPRPKIVLFLYIYLKTQCTYIHITVVILIFFIHTHKSVKYDVNFDLEGVDFDICLNRQVVFLAFALL